MNLMSQDNRFEELKQLTDQLLERDEKIKISEKKFRTLFESSPNPIIITEIDKDYFIDVNPAFCELLGYSKQELVGKNWYEFIDEKQTDKKKSWITLGEEKLQKIQFTNVYIAKNKEKIKLEWSVFRASDNKTVYGISKNITVENELKEQVDNLVSLYENIINNIDNLIKVYDQNLNMIFCSKGVYEITGYSIEEHMNDDNFSLIHPDDIHIIQECAANVLKTKKKTKIEYRGKNKFLGYTWAQSIIIPILDKNKEIQFIVSVIRNIGEEKEIKLREKKFRNIAETSRDVVVVYHPDGTASWASPYSAEITGWSFEELKRINMSNYIHPDDLERIKSEFNVCVLNKTFHKTQVRIKLKYNGYKWFETNMTPIINEKGHVDQIVCSSRDINDIKMDILNKETKIKFLESAHSISKLGTYSFSVEKNCYTEVSKSFFQIFGLNEYIDKTIMSDIIESMIIKDHKKRIKNNFLKTVSDGNDFDEIYTIKSLNGEDKILRGRGKAILDENKKVKKIVGTVQDITDEQEIFNSLLEKENIYKNNTKNES